MSLPAIQDDISSRTDLEGQTAYQLISKFLEMEYEEQKQVLPPREFKNWVERVFRIQPDQPASMSVVLRHVEFCRLVHLYCATKYGEQNFSWSLIFDIVSGKLHKFEEFLDFSKAIFEERMTLSSASDWERIMGIQGQPYDSLLRLFFPDAKTYYDEMGKNYACEIKLDLVPAYEKNNFLNNEASALIEEAGFRYRRPGFLTVFSDKAYVQVFRNLQANRHLSCPSWNDFYHLAKNVTPKIEILLRHVEAWAGPSWTASIDGNKAMQWHLNIEETFFRRSTLIEGGTRPWQGEITDSEREERARVFIECIWNEVATKGYWKEDEILSEQLKTLPPTGFQLCDKFKVEIYMARFNYENWSRLVKFVIDHAGPCLTGPMAQFNNMIGSEGQDLRMSQRHQRFVGDFLSQNNLASQLKPLLNNKMSRQELLKRLKVFEELWQYCVLKSAMLNTLKFGMSSDDSADDQQTNVIKTSELYETAKETLLNIACVLHRSGILVDVDNFHENLSQVDVFSDNDTEDEPPKMGFLSALPRNDGITTDTINAVYCLHGGERELGVKRSSSDDEMAPSAGKRQKKNSAQVTPDSEKESASDSHKGDMNK